jgi:phosphomannomutase
VIRMVSKVNSSIFRAYDIRGVYGKDLDEDLMERIGNAFASKFVKGVAVVGHDCRNSSPSLNKAFIEGARKAGRDVIDVGLVPRGACLFWAWKNGFSSAYVTASHLGKEWNGVKFGHPSGIEFFEEDNHRIRDMVIGGEFREAEIPGNSRNEDALGPYNEYISSKIKPAKERLNVVVDCGNGTGGISAPAILGKLGFGVKVLFGEPDGNFPNRPSEISEETLGRLSEEVQGADMGIAFDGDSDRMSLMDEKGRLLGPEFASYIILSELAGEADGPIIANVECLKIMDEVAQKHKRKLYRIRVGNSFMVHEAEKNKACFGVERSGHFCIPSILPMDDGIVASIYAASVLSRSGRKLSEIFDDLPKYPFRRMKIKCSDEKKFGVIEELKKEFSEKYDKVNTVDGVRVDFDYGWVLIRASNTEPIIRLSVEADDAKRLEELTQKFKEQLLARTV